MLPHPLISFEIQRYCQKEPMLKGVYSRNNLDKRNLKIYRQQKYIKYLYETNKRFNNMWILLYWIY